MSDLVGNPDDRFSRIAAEIITNKKCKWYPKRLVFKIQNKTNLTIIID